MASELLSPRTSTAPERGEAYRWARDSIPKARIPALIVLPAVGALLLIASYHHAAELTAPSDQLQFVLYWLGVLAAAVPLTVLACAPRVRELTRVLALVGIGLFGMMPTLLRSPAQPLDHDEYAHFQQVVETYLQPGIGHPAELVKLAQYFPGLHQAVSAIGHLSGLQLWVVAVALISIAHALSTVGAYLLVRTVGASPQGAAIGAVIFSLNPSWPNFDALVSYESMALPLCICVLVATIASSHKTGYRRVRLVVAAVFIAGAAVVTHHLSTLVLLAVLSLLTLVSFVRRARLKWLSREGSPGDELSAESPWPMLVILLCGSMETALWFSGRNQQILSYLSPSVVGGWAQLKQLIGLEPSEGEAGRTLFSNTESPFYEVGAALLLAPVVCLLILVSGIVLWRYRKSLSSSAWVFAGLALMFPLSLPLVFTPAAGEGVHRSWAFSYLGLAVTVGVAYSWGLRPATLLDLLPRRLSIRGVVSRVLPRSSTAVVLTIVTYLIMLVGGTAAGMNSALRFPGPTMVGQDARSMSLDSRAVASWMAANAPPDTPVLADRWDSLEVSLWGHARALVPSSSFPLWDIYMKPEPIKAQTLNELLDSHARYLVVDSRMATTRPAMGFWFTTEEPGKDGSAVYPASAIARFQCLPWLRGVFAAGPLTVYEVDPATLRATMAGECRRE